MADDVKPCVACAEEIKATAMLCKHCGVMQDDARFSQNFNTSPGVTETEASSVSASCGRCGAANQTEPGECTGCGIELPYDPSRPLKSLAEPESKDQPLSPKEEALKSLLARKPGLGTPSPNKTYVTIPRDGSSSTVARSVTGGNAKGNIIPYLALAAVLAAVAFGFASCSGSPRQTNNNSNTNNTVPEEPATNSGHNEQRCQQVSMPNPNADQYGMVGDRLQPFIYQQQCHWVWVPDN